MQCIEVPCYRIINIISLTHVHHQLSRLSIARGNSDKLQQHLVKSYYAVSVLETKLASLCHSSLGLIVSCHY